MINPTCLKSPRMDILSASSEEGIKKNKKRKVKRKRKKGKKNREKKGIGRPEDGEIEDKQENRKDYFDFALI